MKFKTLSLIALAVVLSGCTVNVADRQRQQDRDWRQQGWRGNGGTPEYIAERNLSNCPMYVMPDARATPTAPLEDYKVLAEREDPKAIKQREALLLDYIERLRYYIKDVNSDNTGQYMKYLMQCSGVVKQK